MRHLAIVLVAAALAACGDAPPPQQPSKTVIDTQIKALERAKAVGDKVEQDAADAAKKIEDAGG